MTTCSVAPPFCDNASGIESPRIFGCARNLQIGAKGAQVYELMPAANRSGRLTRAKPSAGQVGVLELLIGADHQAPHLEKSQPGLWPALKTLAGHNVVCRQSLVREQSNFHDYKITAIK